MRTIPWAAEREVLAEIFHWSFCNDSGTPLAGTGFAPPPVIPATVSSLPYRSLRSLQPTMWSVYLVGSCLVLSLVAAKYPLATEDKCLGKCTLDVRCLGCVETLVKEETKYAFKCQSGYFENEDTCEDECDNVYWSLFTYGTCAEAKKDLEGCGRVCGFRVRVWTTVFIFVVFVAAVVLLVFILPLCISSCRACLVVNKEQKQRKKNVKNPEMYGSYEDARAGQVVPAKSPTQQPGMYNPYMYMYGYGR